MGRVALVGAGPGDPELLTLRGLRLVRAADVVVTDALVDRRVLAEVRPAVAVHDVGKRAGAPFSQAAINELLIDLARGHELVVRLKGGDPFLFGRGGEELEALLAAGVAVEVVPGVPSATAAADLVGVPLTHRGVADGFCVITGHRHGDASLDYDWRALVASGLTLVVLMGAASRATIAKELMGAGAPGETPVAVVTRASWIDEEVRWTSLAALGSVPVASPSTIIIGGVVDPRRRWRPSLPLGGLRIVVTRPRAVADALAVRLRDLGAVVVASPAIEIGPPSDGGAALAAALSHIEDYDWLVLTSQNAVDRVVGGIGDLRRLGGVRIAAIGPATARALERVHLTADLIPGTWVGEGLVEVFGPGPGSVLIARARQARDVVPRGLEAKGWRVDVVEAYETRTAAASVPPELVESADLVVFTAPSTVEGFATQYPGLVPRAAAAIGPVTEEALVRRGWPVALTATHYDADGLVEVIREAREAGRLVPRSEAP
ncbi:uroporphyrin-III C-methyltransferase [Acidimicrobium ferrooxidans DSM 10331]|uniref:uroporphyrinogen-III C-methyltransferase n=1 Tax=Acidimicrobium ferrooxidans (strain DSM 10331 / JCM 15462 / NBRC 103882 / ICP) TaxID=525909 RepID=C7M2H6_ACIFD|nr:uroporphyrinogen-III C-methyltransferase [Acidimicrobium ferrooxidans]ACU53220.1 uroporphyrin-III C-methyltransferase [Acidimicrobium ferrooxidans DSM 10331]